jgi:superfamily I DNA and RNA helicase
LIDKDSAEWWNKNKRTEDEFCEVDVPVKLLDLSVEKAEKYDAIIVDEGQDFKPEWFEFLEGLLKDPDEARFVVFFDEKQDVFKTQFLRN